MWLRVVLLVVGVPFAGFVEGCGGLLPEARSSEPLPPPSDPTPLAKCRVAANATSPLVTEWPASEKAHLQSLAAERTIAVEYTGCDLRLVDGCVLPGSYSWQRTALATDTIEIENADELYAKLPLGAVSLEGELNRAGRLAVRTTVSGQLRSDTSLKAAPSDSACRAATHYISGISVGAFQLISGQDSASSANAGMDNVGAGASQTRRELVLRQAGIREECDASSDEAPASQCASPIQVFLSPLEASSAPKDTTSGFDGPDSGKPSPAAVNIAFPASDVGETWTLRAPGGRLVCTLPCDAWVGPVSGYYLQREPRNGATTTLLLLPQSFPHPPGAHVQAEYHAERGNPDLARWAFYGAIPVGAGGLGLTIWGGFQAACDEREPAGTDRGEDCFPPAGFLLTAGILYMGMAAAGTWWHFYSREEHFGTHEVLDENGATQGQPSFSIGLGPTGVVGRF